MKKFGNKKVVADDDGVFKIYFYESGVKDVYKWDVFKRDGLVTTIDIPESKQTNFIINKVLALKKGDIFYKGCVYFIHKDKISELGELFETEGLWAYKPHFALQVQKKPKGLMILSVGKILRKETTHAMKLPADTSKAELLKQDLFVKRLVGKETYDYDIEELQDVLGATPLPLDKFKYFYKSELDLGVGFKTDQPAAIAKISDEIRSGGLLPWEDEEKWVEEVTRRKENLMSVKELDNIAKDLDSPYYNKSAFKQKKVEEISEEDACYNSRIDEIIAEHNRMISEHIQLITRLEDLKI